MCLPKVSFLSKVTPRYLYAGRALIERYNAFTRIFQFMASKYSCNPNVEGNILLLFVRTAVSSAYVAMSTSCSSTSVIGVFVGCSMHVSL